MKYFRKKNNNNNLTNLKLSIRIQSFFIGIHSMQGWTATTSHAMKLQEKEVQKGRLIPDLKPFRS